VTSKPSDPFYSTREWKSLRIRTLNRQHWRCLWCGESIAGQNRARVDHIRDRRTYPARELDPANVRALCATCDNRRHAEKGRAEGNGADANGWPTSPDHHWNHERETR